ncbi:MAG: GNAT family N-acetyltransferase [Oscillospiraceae bacterium]|nr:GNAT family N-acetyltransferase [Oscillospiraceae bacterium]MBQ9250940.1 GNAT family N-acetyltransferase [Oscillospiraceae bacterium]
MDTLYVKTFRELDIDQLYALLKARHDVFVVEQHCPYPDLDGRDQDSLHLFYADETGRVTAYMRMFPKADEPGTVRISRVLTVDRGTGLGGRLLRDGIRTAREKLGAREIYVEAQSYATGYYAREGFQICSEEFLDDGIPHKQMRLKLE